MADESNANGLLWFAAGVAIGSAIAVLFAPAPGAEVRRKIAEKTEEGRTALQESGLEVFERGRELYERGRKLADETAEVFEKGRRIVEGTAANVDDKAPGTA